MKRRDFIGSVILGLIMSEIKLNSTESNNSKMPALFVGHGSPMNAIEDNEFSRKWFEVGKSLPKPKVILCRL